MLLLLLLLRTTTHITITDPLLSFADYYAHADMDDAKTDKYFVFVR